MGAGRLYGEAAVCHRKVSTQAAVSSYLKVNNDLFLFLFLLL